MVKKKDKKQKSLRELGEAYKGSLSTFLVTLMIVAVGFFLPMWTANQMENAREGKGYFTPEDSVIWDFDGLSDFHKVEYQTSGKDELGYNVPSGTSLCPDDVGNEFFAYWYYHSKNSANQRLNIIDGTNDLITIEDTEIPKVNNNYGNFALIPSASQGTFIYPHLTDTQSIYVSERIRLYFDVDKDLLIDNDASRIEFFGKFDYTDCPTGLSWRVFYRSSIGDYEITDFITFNNDDINILELEVSDLIAISTMGDNGYFMIEFAVKLSQEEFRTNDNVIFDMQIYGLMGKPNAVTLISIWYIAQSFLIFCLGIIMMPQFSFGRLSEMLGTNREW